MSQQEILTVLKKNKEKWFTAVELAKILKINRSSTTKSCQKLRYANFVEYKEVQRKQPNGRYLTFLYKHREM